MSGLQHPPFSKNCESSFKYTSAELREMILALERLLLAAAPGFPASPDPISVKE